jgi:hypothetical protein
MERRGVERASPGMLDGRILPIAAARA